MIGATRDALLTYVADLVARLESFAMTLLPPDDADSVTLGLESDGSLVVDLQWRFPSAPRARHADLDVFERWSPAGTGRWNRSEYRYELRHHELQFRRAYHRHHAAFFVGAHDVATHEHCESTLGVAACDHYAGDPVLDAFDGVERLYGLWLTGAGPDCSTLRCAATPPAPSRTMMAATATVRRDPTQTERAIEATSTGVLARRTRNRWAPGAYPTRPSTTPW